METVEIREKIHAYIEQTDDRMLKMIYALITEYESNVSEELTSERKNIIREERKKYLSGKERSFSWEEVKHMAITGQKPNER